MSPAPSRWPVWPTVVVVATGPSLTRDDVDRCRDLPVIAVKDAIRFAPWAAMLYACDGEWWARHRPWQYYLGRKLTRDLDAARRFGVEHVAALDRPRFSAVPGHIHHGGNSGFQAVNLALHCAERVILLGFDMRLVDGRRHYFGDHPGAPRKPSDYARWIAAFASAAPGVAGRVVNATPGSALGCFPQTPLQEAIADVAPVLARL